jgi:hypothetical protein
MKNNFTNSKNEYMDLVKGNFSFSNQLDDTYHLFLNTM